MNLIIVDDERNITVFANGILKMILVYGRQKQSFSENKIPDHLQVVPEIIADIMKDPQDPHVAP